MIKRTNFYLDKDHKILVDMNSHCLRLNAYLGLLVVSDRILNKKERHKINTPTNIKEMHELLMKRPHNDSK